MGEKKTSLNFHFILFIFEKKTMEKYVDWGEG